MKLKYYLRGLGIGILITVIVMTLASLGQKKELTDEEIIARAEELGMVKQEKTGSILDSFPDSAPEEGQDLPEDDSGVGNGPGEDPPSSSSPEDGDETGGENGNLQDSAADQPQDPQRPLVAVDVGAGEYSDRISKKLLELGLIDDAEAFNHYLVESGRDDLIAAGTHLIPQGASYEEISKILSEDTGN